MAQVKQSNPNWAKDFEQRLDELDKFNAKVGWFESAKYPEGTPVAYVAAIQEYGSGPIPPRPFMRPTMDKKQNEWKQVAGHAAKQILDGKMDAKQGMALLATTAEADIAETISKVSAPPLSPITLVARLFKKQGRKISGGVIGEIAARLHAGEKFDLSGISTKPLNDTGRMVATLTHVVEDSE